jgi:hypothetical protein
MRSLLLNPSRTGKEQPSDLSHGDMSGTKRGTNKHRPVAPSIKVLLWFSFCFSCLFTTCSRFSCRCQEDLDAGLVHHGLKLPEKHYNTLIGSLNHAPYMLQSSFAPAVQMKGWETGMYNVDFALADGCEGFKRRI